MLTGKDKITIEEKELLKVFSDHYINISERSCGTKPSGYRRSANWRQQEAVEVVCKSFAHDKIIKTIKESHAEKDLMAGNNHIQDVCLWFRTTFRKYW